MSANHHQVKPPADVDAAVADIRARLATAQRARLRAEGEHDAAAAAAGAARADLAAEFGVHSVADAQAMLATLEAELAAQVQALDAALRESGH